MKDAPHEAAFTLVEVLIAAAVFVFVAAAAFETLRALGTTALQVTGRVVAAGTLDAAIAQLRSDALSAAAIWLPAAPCGTPAVALMRRDSNGISFQLYAYRDGSLERIAAQAGPIDPCASGLPYDTVIPNVGNVTVASLAASHLTSLADGALFTGAIPDVRIDSHERDYDGSPITYGNGVTELTVDADPVLTTVDLVPGNVPSGATVALTFSCGGRCAANGGTQLAMPEVRGGDYQTCTINGPSLPNSSAYYVASAFGLNSRHQIVVTQYNLQLQYSYTFSGGTSGSLTVTRVGPAFAWPPSSDLSDPYPVDYGANSLTANLGAVIAGAPPSGLGDDDQICAAMNGEVDYH